MVVYGGTVGHGIYKSSDGGASFLRSNAGLTAGSVRSVAVEQTYPRTIYAGVEQAGLFRSRDGGSTWQDVDEGFWQPLDDVMVSALELHPGDGSLYAAVHVESVDSYEPTGPPVIKSPDRGATWYDASGGLPRDGVITGIIADPANPDRLFLGMHIYGPVNDSGGVFRTTDGGSSWSPIGPPGVPVADLAFHAASGTLVASFNRTTRDSERFLMMSRDRGRTWDRIRYPGKIRGVSSIAIGHSPDVLFVGAEEASYVARSSDGGKSWDLFRHFDSSNYSSSVREVAVDPINPSEVYLGTDAGGLWISRDYGDTWAQLEPGLYGISAHAIAFETDAEQAEPQQQPAPLAAPSGTTAEESSASGGTSSLMPLFGGMTARARSGVWKVIPAPDAYRRPRISGTPRVGRKLTCSKGRWTRARRFSYRWLRNGRALPSADDATYRVRRFDRGNVVTCRVRARGPGGRGQRTSRGVRVR